MNRLSAWHGLAAAVSILVASVPSDNADARRRRAAPVAREPLLTIYQGGCRFPPAIAAIFQRLARKVPDRPPYKAWMRASFAFGSLHGIGVAVESHSDFSGHELYFREDQAALKRALAGSGLHVDRRGDVVEAAKFVDKGVPVVSVSIHGISAAKAHPHFAAARSWLGCGAL